jgi:hypothetical protein
LGTHLALGLIPEVSGTGFAPTTLRVSSITIDCIKSLIRPFFVIISSPTPDISSLSLSSSSQQHLHNSYDYEGKNINFGSNSEPQYHFQTSPSISAPSQYTPLAVSQVQLKQPSRSSIPVVSLIIFNVLTT